MPSLLHVIRGLQVIFFGLMVFCALEAEAAATRTVHAALEATIPVSNNGTISSIEITKQGCKHSCGSIIIPYPFGMDTSNYYRYEVLEITVDHYVRINMLAPVTCGYGNSTRMEYELPFPVSNTRNKLTVLGCSVYGSVVSQSQIYPTDRFGEMSSKSRWNGCDTHCVNRHKDIPPSNCSGYGCCKTRIPKGLASCTIKINNVGVDANEFTYPCASAFLVDHEYYKVETLLLSRNDSFVPVILDWAIDDSVTCKEAQRNLSSYACGRNSYCLASQNGTGYQCKCSKGYQGNPYLPRGCQDIDECKEPHKCGKDVICTNTPGKINGLQIYCTPDEQKLPADQENKRRLHIIVIATSGIGISIVIILLLGIGYWLYRGFEKRKQMKLKHKNFERNGGLLLKQKITSNDGKVEKAARIFVIEELRSMTDNFNPSRIIGKGGHGTVYKGMLPGGEIVAIKKSKLVDETEVDQFINEVVILSQINHRHIVKLLGCCLETEVPLLVYEFVSNGTLSHHLHVAPEDGESLLSWQVRVRIASEIAGALAYLHSDAYMPIFHRDIKPNNILLDEKYKAKVADFGLSRSIPVDKSHLTTLVQGTFGYLDPEYFHSSQFTDKSDVYSFGIVLEKGLALYLIKSMKEDRLFEILDARVLNEADEDDVLAVAKLAERCLKLNGKRRPTMKEVSHSLGVLHEKLSRHS
ncbi:hypothetical protein MKX01_032581 [Papaver californicum]|nr:hypothetical protein MKX01_032581 [Papaver californicum]